MAIHLGPVFGLGTPVGKGGDLMAQETLLGELIGAEIVALVAYSQAKIENMARGWNLEVGNNLRTNAITMACEIATSKRYPLWLVQKQFYFTFWDMGGNETNIFDRFGVDFELVANTLGATLVVRREEDDWHFQIQTGSHEITLPLNPAWVEITESLWACRKYERSCQDPTIPISEYMEVAGLGINPSVFNLKCPSEVRLACLIVRRDTFYTWTIRHLELLARARGYRGEDLKEKENWICLLLRSEGATEEEINGIDG